METEKKEDQSSEIGSMVLEEVIDENYEPTEEG